MLPPLSTKPSAMITYMFDPKLREEERMIHKKLTCARTLETMYVCIVDGGRGAQFVQVIKPLPFPAKRCLTDAVACDEIGNLMAEWTR